MNKRKRIIALLLAVVMVFALAACSNGEGSSSGSSSSAGESSGSESSGTTSTDDDDVITLGAMCILTGEPFSGIAYRNAYEMAVEEINANGGILGKQVELVVEDMSTTTDVAVNAANKLLADDSIDVIIGCPLSSAGLAIEEACEEAQMPLLLSGTSPALGDIDNPYVFRMRSNDNIMGSIAMSFAVDNFNLSEGSTVAVLYVNSDFGTGGLGAIEDICAENGINVISEAFNQDDSDVTAQVLSLKNQNPDLLVVWSTTTGFTVASRCIVEQGVECPVLGSAGMCQQAALDNCGTWLEGWYAVCDAIMTSEEPEMVDFVTKWNEKFDPSEISYDSPTAYSTVYLIKEAYELAGSTDTDAFLEALNEIDVDLLLGRYHKFGNIEMVSSGAICQIEDGAMVHLADVTVDMDE